MSSAPSSPPSPEPSSPEPSSSPSSPSSSPLPAVDRVLRTDGGQRLVAEHGRAAVTAAVRAVLDGIRATHRGDLHAASIDEARVIELAAERLADDARAAPRRVFNLTGTVLHTNLGRAPLPRAAAEAMVEAALFPSDVEFDLETGRRGNRDDHVERLICRLTGAEAAAVVNNNAAAVLLVLNTLALRKEVPASRGELIEIGGSFRLPEIMTRAGCRLREVGTTNRVHLHDYVGAIGPRTGAVLKVHTSNYAIVGFTAAVPEPDLAAACRERGVPFVVDLGSGTLVDLGQFGLPHEPTPAESLRHGADLVTFSGDKLLGGPQAGIIAGRRDLVERLARNPLKRALRVDKTTIAALAAVLRLYLDPERLPGRLPALALLTRPLHDISAAAARVQPLVAGAVGAHADVAVVDCASEIGSGALPTREIPSAGLSITPRQVRNAGTALQALAAAFRALPVPVIGRVHGGALVFDCRCLDDEEMFAAQLTALRI